MDTGQKPLLDGVRVLDLSRVLAGPYCSMLLADMGAGVIKIERPGSGDDSRHNYPIIDGESAYFMNLNRNKRGITLDLKSERGKTSYSLSSPQNRYEGQIKRPVAAR